MWQPYQEINITQALQQLTLRIILKALFNLDSHSQVARVGEAFTTFLSGSTWRRPLLERLPIKMPFLPANRREVAKQTLDDFVYHLIANRRAEDKDRGDVLSMLLKAQDEGNTMTDQQVRDQIMTLVAAGHETVQNTLSWTFYLLSQHPEVCEKLLTQLYIVLNGRAPTIADLGELPYLEWVINESWRVYPPVWIQGRQAVQEFELDGYQLPTGTVCILSQWVLHHLPDVWGDPEVFRPERWDPTQAQKIPQGAYFPFNLGPRTCIGMTFAQLETKLVLATILQRYIPRLVSGFPVVLEPLVTLRPKYGLRVFLDANCL